MWWEKVNALFLVLIVLIATLPGIARGELLLSVQPDSIYVEVSSDFELYFCLGDEATGLMGYHLIFSYDPEYLEVVCVDEGSLPAGSGEETFFHCNKALNDTTVEINGAVLGTEVQTPGCLFYATFKALKAGRTYVRIEYSDIRDGSNDKITHITADGVVIITPEISVEESSWGGIKSKFK